MTWPQVKADNKVEIGDVGIQEAAIPAHALTGMYTRLAEFSARRHDAWKCMAEVLQEMPRVQSLTVPDHLKISQPSLLRPARLPVNTEDARERFV